MGIKSFRFSEASYVYAPYLPSRYGEAVIDLKQKDDSSFVEEVQKLVIVLAASFVAEKFDVVVSVCSRFLSQDFFLEEKNGFVAEYIPGHLYLGSVIASFRSEPRSIGKFLKTLSVLRGHKYLVGIEEIIQETIEVPTF